MSREIVRPEGFPISEEEFHEMKKAQMQEILAGRYVNTYSEWCLRGAPGEPPNGFVMALAVFPTPIAGEPKHIPHYVLETENVSFDPSKNITEYWRDITTLQIPKRVSALEGFQYRQLAEHGDQILEQGMFDLMPELIPSAMIAFFRARNGSSEEAAYLICPTFFPPSAAYRHILEQAQLQIAQQ